MDAGSTVIGRRQLLAAAMVLPIACSPSSSKACSIDLPLSDTGAKAVIEKLSQAWWSRDRASFLAQFMEDLEAPERKQIEALYEKYFADPAGERKLGNILVRHNFCIFEVIEAETKRKSGICDGYPSAVIFKARFSAAFGGLRMLEFVDEVLFVPEEWDRPA